MARNMAIAIARFLQGNSSSKKKKKKTTKQQTKQENSHVRHRKILTRHPTPLSQKSQKKNEPKESQIKYIGKLPESLGVMFEF